MIVQPALHHSLVSGVSSTVLWGLLPRIDRGHRLRINDTYDVRPPNAAAVFDDGVKNGAFLTRFLVAEEQPVLGSELGEADGVFDEVVANFYPPIAKIGFEVGPLVDGITDGFAEFALGQDGTPKCEFVDGSLESLVNDAAFGGADGLAQGGAGLGFAQALFNVIEVGELTQEPADEPRGLFGGFEKFPSNIRVAAHEFDPGFGFGPRWIDDVAIALNAAQGGEEFGINRYISLGGLGWLEESGHACGAAAVMPVIEDGGTGDVRRPEVAGLGFAAAGLEASDRGFVKLSVKDVPMFMNSNSI